MTDAARKLLHDVLALPEQERADIATTEVIASLDGPPDADWEATRLAELDRRVEATKRDGDAGSDWSEVRAELLAELRAR